MKKRGSELMTSYIITAGYSSEYGSDSTKPWEVILEAVKLITHKELIIEYRGPMDEFILDMAKNMTINQGCDSSVVINEDEQEIHLLTSGSGHSRRMKECLRRAFIRCVMRRADKSYVDVNVSAI